MKYMFLLMVLFLFVYSSSAQTQSEMDQNAASKYQKADKELNRVYNLILKNNKADTAFISSVKIAQRIWIQFRDAEMKMMFPEDKFYYGSVFSMCWDTYLTQLTNERIKKLNKWIVGEDEGDVCGGSIPTKK